MAYVAATTFTVINTISSSLKFTPPAFKGAQADKGQCCMPSQGWRMQHWPQQFYWCSQVLWLFRLKGHSKIIAFILADLYNFQ